MQCQVVLLSLVATLAVAIPSKYTVKPPRRGRGFNDRWNLFENLTIAPAQRQNLGAPRCGRDCSTEYSPVCGSDSQTYSNECLLGCQTDSIESRLDRSECLTDQHGFDYKGEKSVTASGKTCGSWSKYAGLYPLDEKVTEDPIVDENFPEGSVDEAQNFCRNPDKDTRGPWCWIGGDKEAYHYDFCVIDVCPPELSLAYVGVCGESNTADASTAEPKECMNNSRYCNFWMHTQQCEAESEKREFMEKNCAFSCGFCSK